MYDLTTDETSTNIYISSINPKVYIKTLSNKVDKVPGSLLATPQKSYDLHRLKYENKRNLVL